MNVGFRVPLVVVAFLLVDSWAPIILAEESNGEVRRLEFEWWRIDLFELVVGSFSTSCSRSGMSIVFPLFTAAFDGSSIGRDGSTGVGSSTWAAEALSTSSRAVPLDLADSVVDCFNYEGEGCSSEADEDFDARVL